VADPYGRIPGFLDGCQLRLLGGVSGRPIPPAVLPCAVNESFIYSCGHFSQKQLQIKRQDDGNEERFFSFW
jgi:hypothetical protein